MIKIIESLKQKEIAYEKDGTVYFDITKFPEYGKLSHYSPAQMLLLAKERGADPSDPKKKNPLDFILWQAMKPGEPIFESPFGKGRPGWHIECSAMILDYLGEQIDIHGGGRDLIYPHHESEIAQSESFSGKNPFAGVWMHTSMVQYNGEKMSKSLGNMIMVADLLSQYSANTIRYLLLSHTYRSPWEYTTENIQTARAISQFIANTFKDIHSDEKQLDMQLIKLFCEAMDDDLNTPEALILLNKITQNSLLIKKPQTLTTLKYLFGVLGFLFT